MEWDGHPLLNTLETDGGKSRKKSQNTRFFAVKFHKFICKNIGIRIAIYKALWYHFYIKVGNCG